MCAHTGRWCESVVWVHRGDQSSELHSKLGGTHHVIGRKAKDKRRQNFRLVRSFSLVAVTVMCWQFVTVDGKVANVFFFAGDDVMRCDHSLLYFSIIYKTQKRTHRPKTKNLIVVVCKQTIFSCFPYGNLSTTRSSAFLSIVRNSKCAGTTGAQVVRKLAWFDLFLCLLLLWGVKPGNFRNTTQKIIFHQVSPLKFRSVFLLVLLSSSAASTR